jgi:polyhydroxyalkanoate synthesis regulator phasin
VKEVMTGNGLFRHNKTARKTKAVKKVIDALEGEMKETTGKGIIKSIKKGTKKATKSVAKKTKKVVKDVSKEIKDEVKDLASDAKNEAEEALKKTISKVKNQAKKSIPPEMIETVDLVKKSVKAIDKFDPKQIDKVIKSIPKVYRDEIKNTYVGQMIREALVVGTDIAVDSAIQAMYLNPYTAPLAPMVQIAWEAEQASGQPMTRGVIEKVGLGLGLGLRAGNGLRASGKGLRVGAGLMAGSGNKPEMIKHKVDPFYLENKLTNQPTDKQKIVKQKTHEDGVIMGAGGGGHITGLFLEKPVISGILKPRPLKRVSMLEGKHQ